MEHNAMWDAPFAGAKVMLFLGADLLVLRRDHSPGITWPGYLDFPGGGREGAESPAACAIRETREEVGLILQPDALHVAHERLSGDVRSWFFAACLPASRVQDVVFGNEGAGWQLMPPLAYCDAPDAIPHFSAILRDWLKKWPEGEPPGQ